jgi:flagellar motor protein MotB
VDGVGDEQKRLDETAAAAQKEATDAATAQNKKLTTKKTLTRQALFKAQNNKDAAKEKQFKRELAKIERDLKALPVDMEQKVLQATEPLLVKDAGLLVRLSLDESAIAFPDAKAFTRPKVAFALRREGTRIGVTGWKETEVLILYGDWQEVQPNSFRARMEKKPFASKPQTVMLSVIGDENRTTKFLKQMGLKDIVGLTK